jgi:GMP synthase-like glutamine amidotransferase
VQAGRKCFPLTQKGNELKIFGDVNKKSVELYYTHGDMVNKLPGCAVSLGGNDNVPVQAAAYYRSKEEASVPGTRPIAITFQAHPEYASPELGLRKTLGSILVALKDRGEISEGEQEAFHQDAIDHYAAVERNSIDLMKSVGIILGWFPQKA